MKYLLRRLPRLLHAVVASNRSVSTSPAFSICTQAGALHRRLSFLHLCRAIPSDDLLAVGAEIIPKLHLVLLFVQISWLCGPQNTSIGPLVLSCLPLAESVALLKVLDLLASQIYLLCWDDFVEHFMYKINNNVK